MRVGAVTIGQSPRPDILEELLRSGLKGVEFVEAGALDGLSPRQIQALAPQANEVGLVTRLRDGTGIAVSAERVEPLVAACLRRMESFDVKAVVLLCTASFPSLTSTLLLFRPYQLLRAVAEAVLTQGNLAVVVPHASQLATVPGRWHMPEKQVLSAVLAPYEEDASRLAELAVCLGNREVGLVILDCLGYRRQVCTQLARLCGVPVLSPRMMLASVLQAFMSTFAGNYGGKSPPNDVAGVAQ
ncbi:MAG: AroM family protein [candidate division KSB1 bacterium]|nr:AroM family protein [candidate division KSB1 bacterium]